MALILCPECGKQISDQASSCPSCGCPISIKPISSSQQKNKIKSKVQVIEATSKQWKGIQLIGGLLFLIGIFNCFASIAGPPKKSEDIIVWPLLFMGGIALYIIGRVGGWWYYK